MSQTTTEVKPKKQKTPPPPLTEQPAHINGAVVLGSTATKAIAVPEVDRKAWAVPSMTAKDIMIPKILAMQAMTKAVIDGKAKFGEFRESLNQIILGDTATPLEFIPFFMEKVYVVMAAVPGTDKFKFSKQVPVDSDNENHEYEEKNANGHVTAKWYRTSNFYVLLPKEVAEGTATPYLISFRSTSARAGQKIATTMFMKNLKANKVPAARVIELSGEKTSNDSGTYIVMDVKEKRDSTEAEISEAFNWVGIVAAGGIKVDHSDLEAEAQATPTQAREVSTDY